MQAVALAALVGILSTSLMPTSIYANTLPDFERVRTLQAGRAISDAELIDQDGESFRLADLHGRVTLVFFGFTNCPDVCPTTMANWRRLEKSGAIDLDQVNFVLISVDGERDTPTIMENYLSQFSSKFIGLTEDPAKVRPIAKQFSAAFFKGSPTANDGKYVVTHSPQSYLIDPAGKLRAELYSPSIESMAGIINALIDEADELSSGVD